METTSTNEQPLPNANLTLDSHSNLVRIPLAKKGSWHHPKYGTLEFTDKDFESLEKNFEDNKLGFTPYITFGHLDEEPNSTDSHRKRGDLVRFSRDQDTLFGLFEAKPEAFEEIKAGNYEFASGEFIRNFSDKSTGESKGVVFERAALTNSPYLPFDKDEKATVVLSNSYSCFKLSMTEALIEETKEVDAVAIQFEPLPKEEPLQEEVIEETKVKIENQEPTPALDEKEKEMTTTLNSEAVAPVTEEVTQTKEEIRTAPQTETIAATSLTTEAVATSTTTTAPAAPVLAAADVQAIVAAAVEEVKQQYETKFEGLKKEVETQQRLSNQFSNRLAQEEKIALSQSLSSIGVPPAVVDRLHLIKEALSNQSGSIKLSQGETQVEVDLFKAITQLVTDALGIQAVDETQQGANKGQSNEFIDSIRAITERNRKLVKA